MAPWSLPFYKPAILGITDEVSAVRWVATMDFIGTEAIRVTPRPSLSGSLALAIALLAGCGTHAPLKADEMQVKQFSGKGYLTDDQFSIATSYASWQNGNSAYEIALTVPSQPGRYPLVIYLPALGENRMAGEAWRTTWARAGYAVLCLQLLAEDASAWSSERARMGDFALLARERYSGKVMSDRLQALSAVLQELVRHQSANESPLDRVDLSSIALAGFDLGAYTAMTVAGESLPSMIVPKFPVAIRAVIALSPYASFSGSGLESRYRSIVMPVLSITSDEDADALGLVTSPSLRKAPYEYMPVGDKYLAVLAGIPHMAFSGGNSRLAEDAGPRPVAPTSKARGEGAGGIYGKGGGNGGRKESGGRGKVGSGESAGAGPGGWSGQHLTPTARAMAVAAVQGISTAFLDSVLKDDAIAREWLRKDANRWLRNTGELKRK